MKEKKDLLIGFIGQGFIGKNYANDFEQRGYNIVRYSLDAEYLDNKDKIKDCDFVFIAVPTPQTKNGFILSAVEDALSLVGDGKIAIIKSTIKVGSARMLQNKFKNIIVVHSPEFLTEVNAELDAKFPNRNIVGISEIGSESLYQVGKDILEILPKANFQLITNYENAEFIKYAGNNWFYFKIMYMNLLYELFEKYKDINGIDFNIITMAMSADPRIGNTHLDIIHKNGRGAGGHCFIKDFECFIQMCKEDGVSDINIEILTKIRDKNIALLMASNKDIDLIKEIYA
jgi:nucleotide sugar dehydrogenase